MAYEKQNWQTGDIITAEKMNYIEDGIETNSNFNLEVLEAVRFQQNSYNSFLRKYNNGIVELSGYISDITTFQLNPDLINMNYLMPASDINILLFDSSYLSFIGYMQIKVTDDLGTTWSINFIDKEGSSLTGVTQVFFNPTLWIPFMN